MDAPDTRAITLVDLPLIRRLSGSGTVLDSQRGLTRDARGAHSALLSSILFPRGLYTLVAKSDSQRVVGQFRYHPEEPCAHIVYLAPSVVEGGEDTIWLHILDAMSREAGKHGAQALIAEVEPSSPLFETLRTARFVPYARQMIWRHDPVQIDPAEYELTLHEATPDDAVSIGALMNCVVPRMVQQYAAPHGDMRGFVYEDDGRLLAYLALSEGENGVYIIPFIHADAHAIASDLLALAVAQASRAPRVPVYVSVRSYQEWLSTTLERIHFEPWIEQAIMVKSIAAGIRHPGFRRLNLKSGEVAKPAVPNLWSLNVAIEGVSQEPFDPDWRYTGTPEIAVAAPCATTLADEVRT